MVQQNDARSLILLSLQCPSSLSNALPPLANGMPTSARPARLKSLTLLSHTHIHKHNVVPCVPCDPCVGQGVSDLVQITKCPGMLASYTRQSSPPL
ncbi:MAG: hypothetical protein J3Q66DRAFT_327133 [Benniella sp.]|nr:MAG: hypothetical protein J3Q66DRAFT_327133 [Benniella sp.]